jgi:hypothetical protein
MVGNLQNQSEIGEEHGPNLHELKQENGYLRAIVAELLIKNQKLRWELLGQRSGLVQESAFLATAEGTPLCRNSLIVGMP